MCRNIKPLYNFDPPATDVEIRSAALQFVRKISGFTAPSRVNQDPYYRAVDEISAVASRLLDSLVTAAPSRNREIEAQKARTRAAKRYARDEGRENQHTP
jgi:hypothetical protein